ncbi:hypothetical protein FisN_8Lh254 [Fistulifera solaris]|uniref:Hepatocellular carcinoma-associated antigen 59 n=1 Tax=Fistulifera solaris TaxID=1519565 RepID=A0A1Z5JNH9_FISSO|nr:hypothetical protein FisN_8Lh254 [Fistulifera solaris]|eukprot:GAX15446.1 hypothetical protein FisN_8Lh254 [Fistulifera solaris]
MFKKRANKQANLRRRNEEEEEQSESAHNSERYHDDDSSTDHLSQIQQKKKRRMILESLQYRKGVSAAKLLQQQANPVEQFNNPSVTTDDPREGVIEQKHRLAMEAYIAENLGATTTEQHDKETNGVHNATEQLYAELSEAAMRLAGRSSIDDVGGTMAGTSLAEVVLPVEERMVTLEETARAMKVKDDPMNRLPSKANINSSAPNRFAAPARPKVLYDATTTAMEQERGFMEEICTATTTTTTSDDAPDNDRVGFQAFRRQQNGEIRPLNNSYENGGRRATDDRAFKNFVTKQRERRQNR